MWNERLNFNWFWTNWNTNSNSSNRKMIWIGISIAKRQKAASQRFEYQLNGHIIHLLSQFNNDLRWVILCWHSKYEEKNTHTLANCMRNELSQRRWRPMWDVNNISSVSQMTMMALFCSAHTFFICIDRFSIESNPIPNPLEWIFCVDFIANKNKKWIPEQCSSLWWTSWIHKLPEPKTNRMKKKEHSTHIHISRSLIDFVWTNCNCNCNYVMRLWWYRSCQRYFRWQRVVRRIESNERWDIDEKLQTKSRKKNEIVSKNQILLRILFFCVSVERFHFSSSYDMYSI